MEAPAPAVPAVATERIPLSEAIDIGLGLGASDWHFKAEEPWFARVNGDLVAQHKPPIDEAALHRLKEHSEKANGKGDSSFAYRGEFFRLHSYSTAGIPCLHLRHIPGDVPELAKLGLPPAFAERALASARGLILVTGPTGSGKSTTLAAAVDYLNAREAGLIQTFEDPIEFRHRNRRGIIRQQELGKDFERFASAIRSALRSDPDCLLIGEMRDLETITAALTAADTGHLVLATLHCATARDAISRIVGAQPPERLGEVRTQLAKNLVAVLAQQLVKSRSGGRIGAFELLLATPAVRNLIADPANKYDLIPNEIATGSSHGMIAMDQSLADLVGRSKIEEAEALKAAVNPAGFSQHRAAARA